jgi:hypothetical protein
MAVLVAALCTAAPVEVARRRVVTDDGASIALHRFFPPGGARHHPAILLVADVGFGRVLHEPLARALAESGRAVYLAELRGQGAADSAHSLRTAVHLDLPAVARALAADGRGPIDLVAQGWLGTLALAATVRELPVRRVVALNTPALPEPPTELVRRFLRAGGRFSALTGNPGGFAEFEQLFAMFGRFPPRRLESFGAVGPRDLTDGVASELLLWMEHGDLQLDDGTTVNGRLRAYDRPTLLLLGIGDGWAPIEACAPLRELARGPVTLRTYTRMTDGDDFGPVSMVLGARATTRVFPQVRRFLEAE